MPWAAAAIAIATDAAERAAKGMELKPARVRVHLPVPALLRERSWWPWLFLEFYLQLWVAL